MAPVCELCGRTATGSKNVVIEGATLVVCPECARFGTELKHISPRSTRAIPPAVAEILASKSRQVRDIFQEMEKTTIVSDYPKRIRDARVRLGLTPEELGRQINEKKSVINQLETGALRPDNTLIRKLEKRLNIKLREQVQK